MRSCGRGRYLTLLMGRSGRSTSRARWSSPTRCAWWAVPSSTPADPHAQGEASKHGITGSFQFESHPVTRADVGAVNVDLPDVQRRPCVCQLDHPVDDWTDRVVAH